MFQALGSTERFEHLCKLLLLSEYPKLQTIDGRPGDEGKDSFLGTFDCSVTIFQIKCFDRMDTSQRNQIESSLKKAAESKPREWVLLIPIEFNKFDWAWFERLRKEYSAIKLDVWQGTKIESLMLDPKNDGLKEFFPELFPTSTIVDRAVQKTLEKISLQRQQTAIFLIEQIKRATTADDLVKFIKNSRSVQYSAEIVAAQKIVESHNDEKKALTIFREIHEKAVSESDTENELGAIYGIISILGRVPQPGIDLLLLADRGIALATQLGRNDVLALIESEKAMIIQSLILLKYRRLSTSALVMKTTRTIGVAIPFLRQEEGNLQKSSEDLKQVSTQAISHAVDSGNAEVLATVIMQIGFSIGLAAFQYQSLGEDVKRYAESAEMLLENSATILRQIGSKNLAYAENNLAAYWWIMSNRKKSEDHAKIALELAKKTGNKYVEIRALDILGDLQKGILPSTRRKKTDYTPDVQEQMLRFVVREMGIDIDNPRDDTDRAVQTGIRDLNPERVLRFCEYIRVDQVSTSFLGQMVGVPTVGPKSVSCVKFGYGVETFALDSLKKSYCESCKFRKMRDPSWKWNFDWEKRKQQEYTKLLG